LAALFFASGTLAQNDKPQSGDKPQQTDKPEQIGKPQPIASETRIKLVAMPDAPGNRSLREVTSSANFKGTVIYGDFAPLPAPDGPNWTPFLKRSPTGLATQSKDISAFRVEGIYSKAFDPQFSPDGKTILFKVGKVGNRYDTFQLCFWDRATNRVQGGPKDINYRLVYWSPNSRYVAYVLGGDIEGNHSPKHPLELYIYDVKARQSRFIARGSYVKTMAWTPQNTLLYNVKNPSTESGVKRAYEADLYMVSTDQGELRLLVKNAFDPQPSPDGKKLAFFAWPEPETPDKNANKTKPKVQAQLGLYSYDLETKKRTLLRSPFSYRKFIGMLWMPDSRRLLLFQEIDESPSARTQVTVIDITNSSNENLVDIKAKDYKYMPRINTQPQFQPLSVSPDGSIFFMEVSEFVGSDPPFSIEDKKIEAINLKSGKATTIAKVRTSLGVDWFGEVTAVPK
jgi:Tol biopolymer transport system component